MKTGADGYAICECQEERAAIIEIEAGKTREEAERLARLQVKYCRDCPFLEHIHEQN